MNKKHKLTPRGEVQMAENDHPQYGLSEYIQETLDFENGNFMDNILLSAKIPYIPGHLYFEVKKEEGKKYLITRNNRVIKGEVTQKIPVSVKGRGYDPDGNTIRFIVINPEGEILYFATSVVSQNGKRFIVSNKQNDKTLMYFLGNHLRVRVNSGGFHQKSLIREILKRSDVISFAKKKVKRDSVPQLSLKCKTINLSPGQGVIEWWHFGRQWGLMRMRTLLSKQVVNVKVHWTAAPAGENGLQFIEAGRPVFLKGRLTRPRDRRSKFSFEARGSIHYCDEPPEKPKEEVPGLKYCISDAPGGALDDIEI